MIDDKIKCNCSSCGAKYRLPQEAQGRTARCKRCGEKFDVPRAQSLEDSVITWLTGPVEDDDIDDAPQPRVINMPGSEGEHAEGGSGARRRGPIRMRSSGEAKGETA